MKFKKVSVKIEKGQTITSLYHSPFDYNLLYLICLAKTGLRIRIVLDDIDNIGINRESPATNYSYSEKYFLSKTERTNIRPLSLVIPKHLFANLAVPSLKDLDAQIGVVKLKEKLGYNGNVEHWIKNTTSQLGTLSLIGPDRAFAFSPVDQDFLRAIRFAKTHLIEILSRFNDRGEQAIKFIDWLIDDQVVAEKTISDYYLEIINKIVHRFDLGDKISVERMSDKLLQDKNREMLIKFKEDASLQKLYSGALSIDGKKAHGDFPFYSVSKEDGSRLLPIEKYLDDPDKYIIAPKVLMLNNLENLVLPYHAIDKANVQARELMYNSGKVSSNQVFCDDKWFDWVSSFGLKANLDSIESQFYDRPVIDLGLLKNFSHQGGINQEYKDWIVKSTIRAFDLAKYPIIFLALLQNDIFYKEIPDFYKLEIL